ncbi:polysaccharide biosynthesis/export family protein [Pseudorhodoplanes sp.]|uniref:polysaccharide biosynthesis/export family protein n=1 Tax=Pseudorhodoplanes sp. TaxID=1934341 RepID=UPI002C41BADA|nr:polysaccharide biosynthesis/export family protein [Pseudorhodoplanes sp.]HWV40059.1 polysaccharide biosynthesis/export family protein [Pseudorhodoplanes sp.]
MKIYECRIVGLRGLLHLDGAGGLEFGRPRLRAARRWLAMALLLCAPLLTTGCGLFPASGPYSPQIMAYNGGPDAQYELVPLSPGVATVLSRRGGLKAVGSFSDRPPAPDIRLGVGDVVSVTVFEAQAGGLFIPLQAASRPGNFVQIPNQTVDRAGNITVPYAGQVRAAGRTVPEVQNDIVAKLRNRAIEPQVVISIAEQRSNLVSVMGDVNNPVKFALSLPGERILDSIARAGGPKSQGWQTFVTLQRRGHKQTVGFNRLISEPENNINVQPGDTIYVFSEQQTFLAFGATGQQGQFNFDQDRLSLAEAVAKAGGLIDQQADPRTVFIYRVEPIDILAEMGVDVSRWGNTRHVPVIYWANFGDPAGYFLATQTPIQNKDVIYISNAATVDFTKFLQFVRDITATAQDHFTLRNTINIKSSN